MRWLRFLPTILALGLVLRGGAANAQDTRKDEAQSHFDLGVTHFDREEWPAALAEFQRSREIFKSRGNTKNLAICLRKLGRFDEALDMFESMLRDFPDMPPADVALVKREISELQASVGTLSVQGAPAGAVVSIDGVERGTIPLAAPVRLSAGAHSVRVTKDGTMPFERRVDLAGRQALTVEARLVQLTRAGRLRVVERDGRSASVVVDGAVVGQTPWEGAVSPGEHNVLLRGEAELGTPPRTAKVKVDEATSLTLALVPLPSKVRVVTNPRTAFITIDDVPVGQGDWAGRLALGHHRVTASLAGYKPYQRDFDLAADDSITVNATLTEGTAGGAVVLELDAGGAFGVATGGDLGVGLPIGLEGVLHGGYQLASGLAVGLSAGVLTLSGTSSDRQVTATSPGALVSRGSVEDALFVRGLMVGFDGQYRTRGEWPVTARLGVGLFLGGVRDQRVGSLVAQQGGSIAVDTAQTPSASYLIVAPELRAGRRLGDHFQVSVGVQALVMPAFSAPRWDASSPIGTGRDGQGRFDRSEDVLGSLVLVVVPSLGVAYEL